MKSPGRGGKGVFPKGDKVRDPIFTRGDINLNTLVGISQHTADF